MDESFINNDLITNSLKWEFAFFGCTDALIVLFYYKHVSEVESLTLLDFF